MMTRKDYVATSAILNKFYQSITVEYEEQFDNLVADFAVMFEDDNARFMGAKFVDACYGEDN